VFVVPVFCYVGPSMLQCIPHRCVVLLLCHVCLYVVSSMRWYSDRSFFLLCCVGPSIIAMRRSFCCVVLCCMWLRLCTRVSHINWSFCLLC
jgi:hypothetical protein